MQAKYLGDSYDIVKRFWAVSLGGIAHLYAHPKFISNEIWSSFTAVTTIPILKLVSPPTRPFGILLDPHTGIPFPSKSPRLTPSHAPLLAIMQLMDALHPRYMICFDQSFHRAAGFTKNKQMQSKMDFLRVHGLPSFYYVSHASFLFITETPERLDMIRHHLAALGIPESRFADCQ